MSNSNEDDLFRQAMGDVKPLKTDKRVALNKAEDESAQSVERRRQAAVEQQAINSDALSDNAPQLDPFAISEFKRPGIQHGVFKNLRLGKYTIDARLDLHKLNVEQARRAVVEFIKDCRENDIRCALISHGKGENREHPALLKSHVAHWLPQLEEVMALHTAQKQHGGTGATYVLLKKSEKKRLENLEKHQKKKG